MKKLIIYLFLILPVLFKAQAYELGDCILNVNIGGPQITPFVIKTAIKLYYNSKWADNSYDISVKNSGVLNGKAEYAVHEHLGLGLAASYWNMGVDLVHNYNDKDPSNQIPAPFVDRYHFDATATAIGLRGNYHLFGGEKRKVIDVYSGLSIGLTRYNFNVGFKSDFPDKQLPIDTYEYRSGWGTYFSGTLGMRLYLAKFIGLNMEAGWDRGAFLFGGLVFKIHTNPPQFLKD